MKHRFIIPALLLVFIWGILSSLAGNPDAIIQKHIEAHGGQARWDAIRSISMKGKFSTFSVRNDFETIISKDGGFYHRFFIGHQEVFEGDDGKLAWTIDPWQGFTFPRRINAAEKNAFDQKAVIASPFFDYKAKGHRVEYVGEDNLDGVDLYVLRLVRSNGLQEHWYLDQETYLAYKSTSQWIDFARPSQSEVYYEDYREVGGILFPFFSERTFGNRLWAMEVEELLINTPYSPGIFSMPACPGMEKIAFLQGNWNVEISTLDRLGNWAPLMQTDATVTLIERDLLEFSMVYGGAFPALNRFTWSYNRQNNTYFLTLLNDFYSSTEVYQGQFQGDVLILENIHSTQGSARTPAQYRLMHDNKGTFVIERWRSADQGASWTSFEKQVYTPR